MGGPELHSDEKILLTTQNVFVKSIPFEAILTNKRVILIDRKKNLIPPKDILLATIRDLEGGENAIRDQIITLSLITSTGETRQLVLTFSRTAGGGRKRERDEWLKALKEMTSSSIQRSIRKVVPSFDEELMTKPKEQAPPRIEITNRPAPKKEIEAAHPMKKIVETGNVPPKPVETSSLPTGSFCNRCGNRVPPGSLFCNRCGTKVIGPDDAGIAVPAAAPAPAATEPDVPQVTVESRMPAAPSPVYERKERPVEKEIRSIEPLIEGSVPRTSEAPPVEPSKTVEKPEEAASAESSIAKAAQSVIDSVTAQAAAGGVPASSGDAQALPAEADRNRSVFPDLFPAKESARQPVPEGAPPAAPVPPPAGGSGSRRRMFITIGIVIIILIALAGGAFMYWNYLKGNGSGEGTGTGPTPEGTTIPVTTAKITPVPTTAKTVATTQGTPAPTQALIPEQGVWVRVVYPNTFKGSVGTAGNQQAVSDTGDKFYSISTAEGIVEASIQKTDGSGDELVVEVYKNGSLVKRGTTTVPRGTVELRADLKPPTTLTTKPTTIETTIPSANTTTLAANVTATGTTASP